MPDFKRNIQVPFSRMVPYWGAYTELEDVEVPSKQAIQEYQKKKIKNFSNVAKSRAGNKHQRLNNLFKNDVNSFVGDYIDKQEKTINEYIDKIVRHLNFSGATRWMGPDSTIDFTNLNTSLSVLREDIKELNLLLSHSENEGIPGEYLDKIEEVMKANQLQNCTNETIKNWYSNITNFQGKLIEDIGVTWLNKLKLPELNSIAINTGALEFRGNKKKFGRKGQLIQDIMVFSMSQIELEQIPITYKITGGKPINGTIWTLIQDIEKANNMHKHIQLDDNAYEILLNLSAVNIQAKSGINQLPWNISADTSITLGEYASKDGLLISAKRTFELLDSLNEKEIPGQIYSSWVKETSRDYQALANYGLATVLSKILHLGKYGNNYILTPQGFTSYYERLEYLMDKKNSYIRVIGEVQIVDNTLEKRYDVGMVGYKTYTK